VIIIDNAIPHDLFQRWNRYLEQERQNPGFHDEGAWGLDFQLDHQTGKTKVENAILTHWNEGLGRDPTGIVAEVSKAIGKLAASLTQNKQEPQLLRFYTNYITQTDHGCMHVDSEKGGVSAVWYVHYHWDYNNGAELMIYDFRTAMDNDNAVSVMIDWEGDPNAMTEQRHKLHLATRTAHVRGILPLANRVVMFPSHTVHSARPPQMPGLARVSTAFKFSDKSF
ncbi:hypothetical protein AAMO2058_001205000, partial [Amorphochlora amoebiformis]